MQPIRAKRPAAEATGPWSAVKERKRKIKSTRTKVIATDAASLDSEFDSVFGSAKQKAPPSTVSVNDDADTSSPNTSPSNSNGSDNDATTTPSQKAQPSNGFSDMNIPRPVLRQLAKMNIKEPTPIQRESIPIALEGTDVMGLAQTGTGKTLAFGVPLISKLLDGGEHDARGKNALKPKGVSALVLAPTRELANQIADQMRSLTEGTPVSTMVVYGGVRLGTQANKLRNGVHILVATPGRLIDLVERDALSLRDARFLVLDESDMMLDMGFAPSLKKIVGMLSPSRQTMLFSATMNERMAEVAQFYLERPVRVEVARSGRTADKVTQELHYLQKMDKMTKLLSLMNEHEGERTLVFGRTKHGMEKLCRRLEHAGIRATSIHGNKSQPQRDRAIRDFKSGARTVLVATDVAARGLDIPEVKHVYNYELPDQEENYVHRIGRTARAGKDGASISFCSPEEMNYLAAIEKVIGMQIPVVSGSPWGRSGAGSSRGGARERSNRSRRGNGSSYRPNGRNERTNNGRNRERRTFR